jgi:tetratricopeptide (TPR) repeat protein
MLKTASPRLQSAQRMSPERPPKVFISYSHDSPEHEDRVLDLAERLVKNDGIDVSLDRFVNPPPASWPKWMNAEMKAADFILVVCSATYLAKVESKVKPGEGKGVKWESLLSYQQIYDNDSDSSRFIPVLLEGGKYEHIPDPMRGGSHYRPEEDAEYEKLIRHITNQPEIPKPKPGPLRKLPPKQRQAAKNPATKAAKVPAVSTPWNVPHARNEAFTGREQILSDLRSDLVKKGMQALSGLGGVGKTQIAVEYAFRHREKYTAVLWIFADTEQSVRGGFTRIAALLNLAEKDADEQARVTESVQRWLEENSGWLLVLDNADDPDMVKQFLPQQGKGHILLTSRAHAVHTVGVLSRREVNVLAADEAREFLLRRTGKSPSAKSPEADALAKEMGYLPLALEQAAAYVVETGAGFGSYLASFRKQGLKLLGKQGPVLGNDEREQQKRTVATTWALNFANVEKSSPASAELLRLSAFLAPDAIPLELLEKGGQELPEVLAANLAQSGENPLIVDELLSPLRRYSLIRRSDGARSYSIHPLVQAVVREGMSNEQLRAWVERAVCMVNAAFPDPTKFENWSSCDRLLPHALICTALINLFELESRQAMLLPGLVGYYLQERGQDWLAEPLYEQALKICEKELGPEDPETATILDNLANVYCMQGRFKKAEPLCKRALAIREKAFGPENPSTAVSLHNLADLHRHQRQFKKAKLLYQRALGIMQKTFGEDHPHTAVCLHNLALVYGNDGRSKKSETLHRRVLAIDEKMLGAEHPSTATSLNNLAWILSQQGKHAEAEPMFRRALEIREKSLGLEHAHTVQSMYNLADLYRGQSRCSDADQLMRKTTAFWEREIGPMHPEIAKRLNDFVLDGGINDGNEPGQMFRGVLDIFEKSLGTEHPTTATLRHKLIQFYREQGRNAEADALEKAAKGKAQ